jgi:hypothetical protein
MNNGTTTNGTMNNGTTTNGTMNNGTMNGTTNNGTMNNGTTGTWNGVSSNPSTSWAPEKDPSWSWNNNGVWSGSANWNSNPNSRTANGSANMNNGTMNNGNMNADGSMSSTGAYSAYSGVAVPSLPANVQMRFSQDFPAGVNNQYAWHQYGDWFHTHHLSNGRLIQYFYDQRGSGYSLALPVLHTYVPENIVASALNKYGSSLYSIAMVRTADSADTYQIGLLQGGQLNMQYLNESGATVTNVWRVDSIDNTGAMNSMQSNAAMGSDASMSNGSNSQSASGMNGQSGSNSDLSSGTSNGQSSSAATESKVKIEHADGSETKIKTKDGKTKVKTKPATSNSTNNLDQNQNQ